MIDNFDDRLFPDVADDKDTTELAERLVSVSLETAGNVPQFMFAFAVLRATGALVGALAKPGCKKDMLTVAANYFQKLADDCPPAATN